MDIPIQSQNHSLFKNIFLLSFFSSTLLFSFVAEAKKAKSTGEAKSTATAAIDNSNIKNLEVKNDEIHFLIGETAHILKKRGEGIRKKKVAIVNVDVYKIGLYVPDSLMSESNAFTILESPTKGLVMQPLRSFGGDKLKDALLDSYKVNSVDENADAHKKFISLISASKINKGEEIIIFGHKTAGTEHLYIKRKDQFEGIQGHEGFVNQVFAVWLGKPVDKQLEALKQSLLGAGK